MCLVRDPSRKAPERIVRLFWPVLACILFVTLGLRLILLIDYLRHDPLSAFPVVDAATYWGWAARIASGQPGDNLPFFSAPLYPYLIGLLRSLGGGLSAVYALQIGLDLGTIALLAWITRERFGAGPGILAAGLYALMLEPASFSLRVLASTVQILLVCLVWLSLLAGQRRPSLRRGILIGALIGLLALSYAPALLGLLLFGVWWWWSLGRTRRSAAWAAAGILAGLLVISPATIHNYRVTHEVILISANAGVNFTHGNAPGSRGVYTIIPDIRPYREGQDLDALDAYRNATGRQPTWRAVDRYFFRRGMAYLTSHPGQAIRLFALKAYWFLTGNDYSDIYVPDLERDEGLLRSLHFTPVRTAWLVLPALLVLLPLVRRPLRHFPELALLGLPLLTVLAYFYTPRYRLPVVPVIIAAAAAGAWRAARWRENRRWSFAFAGVLAAALVLPVLNHAWGFDRLDPDLRATHNYYVGVALAQTNRPQEAVARFRRVVEIAPSFPNATRYLGQLLQELGQTDEAISHLQTATKLEPGNAELVAVLARALAQVGRREEAIAQLRRILEVQPNSGGAASELGNLLLDSGRSAEAMEVLTRAVRTDPKSASAHNLLARAFLNQGRLAEGLEQFRLAVQLDPNRAALRNNLANALLQTGDSAGAREEYRAAIRINPDYIQARLNLASLLADSGQPDSALVQVREALRRSPESPVATLQLARLLFARGETEEGMTALRRAATLAPDDPVIAQELRARLSPAGGGGRSGR